MKIEKIHIIYYAALLLILIFSISPWFADGVPVTDDFTHHLFKFWHIKYTNEISAWTPFIYEGTPFLHFYHPLTYYIMFPFIMLLSPIASLKFSVVLTMIISAISMYYASYLLFNKKEISLIASVSYLLSSFFINQVTVTGSIPRMFAYSFLPLGFAFFIKAMETNTIKNISLASIFLAASFLSHISVAYPLFLLLGIYFIFDFVRKKRLKEVKTLIIILLLFFGLISFCIIPIFAEKQYSNLGDNGIFSKVSGAFSFKQLFSREFGIYSENNQYIRSYYLGYSVLFFSLIAAIFCRKVNHVKFLAAGAIFILIIGFSTSIYSLFPFAGSATQGGNYIGGVLAMLFALLAGVGAYSISNSLKIKKEYLLLLLLAIIVIDLIPGTHYFSYGKTNTPSELFYNTKELVNVWENIGQKTELFRVFSLVGQVPFLYHGKQEFGYGWQGDPQEPPKLIFQINNKIHSDFIKDPLNNATNELLGFFGVKYYVMPCSDLLDKGLSRSFSSGNVCSYENPFFEPLITSPSRIVYSKNYTMGKNILDTAVILEECENNCTVLNTPALITDVNFGMKIISFKSQAEKDSYVLIKSNYFKPHWHAYVNEKETGIQTAWPDYMLIKVPSGKNNVKLEYKTNAVHIVSLMIFILTLVIIFALNFKKWGKIK